ncbi:HlyD family efflux transporter periplasmic adaptor subunit [Pseudoluteimonas lycopersici]|uniref:HlyD family efflux transporter periplasmic adaptor subunit n=1 Tax=Pseudoluteimonas lycopersici TaxID=1324796 RepID=A0A516V4G8_9GAMM|nr:HlyD family efflux transporter periplasmic adaptor subunit [Lysobacter lycopersici]QDQ73426.1 HlyD family efflux transporter periplasmic adaptor subunit [Lysobacter lycopersici]
MNASKIVPLFAALLLAACAKDTPQALGTLEYDRITLPAPVAERIASIDVREGQQVDAGARLLTLERTRTEAQTEAAQAEAQRQREALGELEAGPRSEQIAQARASVSAAQAAARDANAYYDRLRPLGARKLVAAADVDRARAAASSANAQVKLAQAALDELLNGSRREDIAQGEAAVRAAEAQATAQVATLDKLDVRAPRAGRIDSLPYRLGDQAPVGAPLAILLVGDAPYARIYVPETIRANVKVGDKARVFVDGRDAALSGTVRMIRSEASFTPYYALIGKDAARLSYLAEIALGKDATQLPAGLPVRVEFDGR